MKLAMPFKDYLKLLRGYSNVPLTLNRLTLPFGVISGSDASDTLLVGSGRSRSPESDPAALRAASDSKIELVDVAEGVVSLRIRKKTGSDGWRTRIVTVAEGKPVGDVDPSTGLDWTTGRTVAKIAEALSETERSRDEVVFDAAGRVVLEGGIPKRVSTVRREVWRTVSVTLSGGGAPDRP